METLNLFFEIAVKVLVPIVCVLATLVVVQILIKK